MLFRWRERRRRTVGESHADLDLGEILDRLLGADAELDELARARQYAALERSDGTVERAQARLERAPDLAHVVTEGRKPRVEILREPADALGILGQADVLPAVVDRLQEREERRRRR